MIKEKYVVGVDFGTQSARAILASVETGNIYSECSCPYPHGVLTEQLPDGTPLPPDWALLVPEDYLYSLREAVRGCLRNWEPEDIIAIGIDSTACTLLPIRSDGKPLTADPEWQGNPHAYIKLWKHHGAEEDAALMNRLCAERGEEFFPRYGKRFTSESFWPKCRQLVREAPEVVEAADLLIEAGDWLTYCMTGVLARSACMAGYKAQWQEGVGYPSEEFLAALHPALPRVCREKLYGEVKPLGAEVGGLTREMAEELGLLPGTVVAVANTDAHVALPAVGITDPGKLMIVLGTSAVHLVLTDEDRIVPGMCGTVKDGACPGYYCVEGGQSSVGDIFEWYTTHCVPAYIYDEARDRGMSIHALLERQAQELPPGSNGLLALDWFNGNRNPLSDTKLSGMLLGLNLNTKPCEIYRALIESTAYGTRSIIERMEKYGVKVDEIRVCGGLPFKNKLLMQIFADVTGRTLRVSASPQTPALGSAMWAAVAAGYGRYGYADIASAAGEMAHLQETAYVPVPGKVSAYNRLYAEYHALAHYFGEGENDVMKRIWRE